MRHLILCLLFISQAAAQPARLTIPVTPYTEDLSLWTPARVDEALALADHHLDPCHIDLEWSAVRPLRPGDEARRASMLRTDRGDEVLLVLRGTEDRRTHWLGGVASMEQMYGGWFIEGPWSNVAIAAAQEIGQGKLKTWPKPSGPDAGEAIAKARLALLFAVVRGWITLEPKITPSHCAVLYKRFKALGQRRKRPRGWYMSQSGFQIPLNTPPRGLLIARVPTNILGEAYQVAVQQHDGWRLLSKPQTSNALPTIDHVPAYGQGLKVLRARGVTLLLSQTEGGIHTAWGHQHHTSWGSRFGVKKRRPDRVLKDCPTLLAADTIHLGRRAQKDDASAAIVVCPDRVLQLTPRTAQPERSDPLPPMRWATLTRLGPGHSRLIAAHADGIKTYEIEPGYPPRLQQTAPAVQQLAQQRPDAPIWHAIGAEPVQQSTEALYTPSQSFPIGDAKVQFMPNQYQAVRIKETAEGTSLRVDGIYREESVKVTLPPNALWATQPGAKGRVLWVLEPRTGKRPSWYLYAPTPER